MFKKLTVIFLALISAVGILTASILKVTSWEASAADDSKTLEFEATGSENLVSATINSTESGAVDYYLAWPGILPDHFLYPLKMVRDRAWLFLTTNPLKKSELLLLFADKRLGAGKALIEGNKKDKGLTTLSKAEKYLEQAVNQLKVAKEKGEEVNTLAEKMLQASAKHEQILKDLQASDLLSYPAQAMVDLKNLLGQ